MKQKKNLPASPQTGAGEILQAEKPINTETKIVNSSETCNNIDALNTTSLQENKASHLAEDKNKSSNDKELEFPIYGLPSLIQKMTIQGAEVYQVPQELFAISLISAMCAAIKKKAKLIDKYTNYPQLWIIIIAKSGVGKSTPLSIAFKPLESKEYNEYSLYRKELEKWQETEKKNSTNSTQPTFECYLNNDATPEALLSTIGESNGITIYRDELLGWFNDFGRYAKSGEVETYLSLYNNSDIKVSRKGEGTIIINDPFLSVIGTTQPNTLKKFLKNETMIDNGFIQRFLFVFPPDFPKPYYRDQTMDKTLLADYDSFINDLCIMPETETSFSDEAKEVFIKYSNELTDKINQTENNFLRAVYSKMEIALARLSLVIYIARVRTEETYANTIEVSTVEYCIQICRYFTAMAERVNTHLLNDTEASRLSNADILKELSKRYEKLNQSKLAEAIGITQQAVNKLLNK
jgi:hypothetical protein